MINYQMHINESTTSKFEVGATVRCERLPGRSKSFEVIGNITKILPNKGFGANYKIKFYKDKEFLADESALKEINREQDIKLSKFEPERVYTIADIHPRKYKVGDVVEINLHHFITFKGLKAVVESLHPSTDKVTYEYTVRFIDFLGRARVFEDEMKLVETNISNFDDIKEIKKDKEIMNTSFKTGDYVHYSIINANTIYMEIFGKITQIYPHNVPVTYRIRFYEQREINVTGSDIHIVDPITDKLYEFKPESINSEVDEYLFNIGDSVLVQTSVPSNKIFNGLKATIESLHPYSNIKGSYQYTIRFNDFKGRMRISEWELSLDNSKKDNKEKMNSSNTKFKFNINDSIRYIDKNKKHTNYNKFIGSIKAQFPSEDGDNNFNEYTVAFPDGYTILALEDELESVSKSLADNAKQNNSLIDKVNKSVNKLNTDSDKTKSYSEYIGAQKPVDDIKINSKVLVDGKDGGVVFNKDIGVVKNSTKDEYFIEIQENESKNRSKYYAWVPKELVSLIERNKNKFEIGDTVICVDNLHEYYKKTGEIIEYWEQDNSYMVKFGMDEVWMEFKELKYPEDATFPVGTEKKKIGFQISNTSKPEASKQNVEEEEEEEEDTTSNNVKRTAPLKKDDLVEFSYEDFFTDKTKISNIDDIKALKAKFQDMMGKSNSKIKALFAERAFHSAEIIESYFNFLSSKIANDLPVLRINDLVDDTDLLSTKTKVRASDNKELTNKYSFDQGIVVYWKFKDAVVFKTL